MLEKTYTWEAAVREDSGSLSIKPMVVHDRDDSHGYLIKLEDIASVSDDPVPETNTPAPLPKSSLPKGRVNLTGQRSWSFCTDGEFVNPLTKNSAYMCFKHPDQCVTITLKHDMQLLRGGHQPNFLSRDLLPYIREISFEVVDKGATKEMIQNALPTPVVAAPQPGMKFCPSCGVQILSASKFCSSCGAEQPT